MRAVFDVRGADCATCMLAVEKRLKKIDGVKQVGIAIMLNEVFVDYDPSKVDERKISYEIRKSGYGNRLVRKS